MKITTSYDPPPIPDRREDWTAIDADTFDAEYTQDGLTTRHPVGRGRTEAAAIADLLEQIEERG